MYRTIVLCLWLVLFSAVIVSAKDTNEDMSAKTVTNKDKPSEAAAKSDKAAQAGVSEDKKKEADVSEGKESETKELSGMSIVGNDEAPKSLYIVPWKGSEIGVETTLDMMLTGDDVPVDREVFKRSLEFYEISTKK